MSWCLLFDNGIRGQLMVSHDQNLKILAGSESRSHLTVFFKGVLDNECGNRSDTEARPYSPIYTETDMERHIMLWPMCNISIPRFPRGADNGTKNNPSRERVEYHS